jgi:hypothetical protein
LNVFVGSQEVSHLKRDVVSWVELVLAFLEFLFINLLEFLSLIALDFLDLINWRGIFIILLFMIGQLILDFICPQGQVCF